MTKFYVVVVILQIVGDDTRGPVYINNHILSKVWDEITYPFLNVNGATVEVWEWISIPIPHIMMDVITYPFWD